MPLLGTTMDGRSEVFRQLKPTCVALGQAVVALNSSTGSIQAVTAHLEELRNTLSAVTARENALDEKLAEYVFFPLGQLLRLSQRVSVRCLELTFQCLAILISQGWRSRMQPQLAGQLVILCTLMADKRPQGLASSESTDELQASAFTCLHHLFQALNATSEATSALVSESNIPQLGQTISTILNGIVDGVALDCQVAAMNALQSLVSDVATRDIKASFLPGIVSQLTKVLIPQTKQRRNHAIIIGALDDLRDLFASTLSHGPSHPSEVATQKAVTSRQANSAVISNEWRENAAIQLKPAIESITRLRSSARQDVKEALARLCFAITKDCRKVLSNCTQSALETLLFLSSEQTGDAIKFQLEMLVTADPALSKLLQSALHSSLQSLPTQMQTSDEQMKLQKVQQISTAYGIVGASGADTNFVDGLLANSLRDSVVAAIRLPGSKLQAIADTNSVQSLDIAMIDNTDASTQFRSPLVKYRGQEELLGALRSFAINASVTSNSSFFAADLARSLRQCQGEMQIATFWLLLDCTQAMFERHSGVDMFLVDGDGDPSVAYREHLEDIYSFSLEILTAATPDEPVDSRLQALALRTLALKAQVAGKEFRYELIDALYPVLHTLATPDDGLQRDSIATLNVITSACGYESVKDLIVYNVDYLTNAVALKLNAFDVSPQGPQVLLMMVRLAGPSLLPYLEDTISSIFAALEDYHGYPLLVELLFRVLRVVAEEGSKAPQLAITADDKAELHRIKDDRWQSTTTSSLAAFLKGKRDERIEISAQAELEPHPQRPWKQTEDERDQDAEAEQEDQAMTDIDLPPPAPKTYALLLKISDLTQHFLPSASASLRMSLLSLIKTTIPAIARHENSFLPLINTLWPEVASRLEDSEPQVLATALEIIALLCEHAGDFMRTRILQLWPAILEIHQKTAKVILQISASRASKHKSNNALMLAPNALKKAIGRMRANPADYSDTSTRLVWGSLVRMIVAAVGYVGIPPARFDEALEMLLPVLEEDEVRETLEKENADAVWLARLRMETVGLPEVPKVEEGFGFAVIV